jgi:hypothetical protein
MSTLTSFGAFHEPPSQAEDPPENVFSKLFLRVKNTLSTHGSAASDSQPTGDASKDLVGDLAVYSSSESYTAKSIHGADSGTSSSSFALGSDSGSWIITPDSKGNGGRKGITTLSGKSSEQLGLSTPHIMSDDKDKDKDRAIATKRLHAGSLNVSKRPSSLFKVSTMDHIIVQDDDSVSLTSMAPPVVSFSPAFGDQQVIKAGSLNEHFLSTTSRSPDGRIVDHTRLNPGTSLRQDSLPRDGVVTVRGLNSLIHRRAIYRK